MASTGLFSFNTIFCIGTRIVLPKYRSHHIHHAQPPLEVSTVNYKSVFFLSLAHKTLQILTPICITDLLQSTLSLARVHATTFSSWSFLLKCYALRDVEDFIQTSSSSPNAISLYMCQHSTHSMINSHITTSPFKFNPLLPSAMFLVHLILFMYITSFEEIRVGAD